MFHSLFICEQATGNSTDTTTGTSIRPTSHTVVYTAKGLLASEGRVLFLLLVLES